MDIKTLNEVFTKLLEGEVVDFTKYKRRKQANAALQDMDQEIIDTLSNKAFIDIESITCVWAEGRIDGQNTFKESQEYSYEDFQTMAYEFNYANKIEDTNCKVKYDAKITIRFKNETIQETYTGYLNVGSDDVNIIKNMIRYIKPNLEAEEIIVTNDEIFEKDLDLEHPKYANLQAARQTKAERDAEQEQAQKAKMEKVISPKGYGKKPQDVEVGDILVCEWGYSMSLVDFYRVIKRTATQIQIEKLQDIVVEGDGMSGKAMPTSQTEPCKKTDGKRFSIGSKYNPTCVCRVDGHSLEYWNGKGISFDRWD